MSKFSLIFVVLSSILLASCSKDTVTTSEEDQITNYIKSKNLTVTEKTATGLRYILVTPSANGAAVKAGQTITVKYAGRLLTDAQFDAGTFSFVLGAGRVVSGFDEGIAKMKVGEQSTIIFPSALGYGSQGSGSTIPPNSPLLFNIEVVSAR